MKNYTIHPTRIGISFLLIIGLCVYFYQFNPSANEGYFLRCPTNSIFGINCPGCGVQRAIHHLLHLELVEAFRANALFVLSLPFIFFIGIDFILGTKKTTRIPTNRMVWIGLLLLVLLFGIMRNVSVYPFTLLSP
ncbi:DUF2752 domain-containing protein [Faecalibacter sp. LW9]|uniref:DUF2752 domain-containing protein n=1 Tax=Faecalibacter sp. LW9 TaxID=3103144 RepID=UPI002AFED74C|nr:DUF2752 domain-containing protein [Faecalibacter sp. LW9]